MGDMRQYIRNTLHIKKIDIPGTVSVISQKMAPMYKPGWNPKNFGYCPDTQR